MQQFALLWRFVLMLIRIRRSKDLLEQFQEFECSSLFAFNSCVYRTTHYNKCGRIGTKWLFFFTFTEECCVVIEKNIGKKLPNRIIDQAWYKRCLKGTFGRGRGGGSKSAKEGPYPLWHRCPISASGYGPPGPNPLADMDLPGPNLLADLDPSTKLSENIILNVLLKMDDTLRSRAHWSMCSIQNMRIVDAYELASRWMFLLTKGKWARI